MSRALCSSVQISCSAAAFGDSAPHPAHSRIPGSGTVLSPNSLTVRRSLTPMGERDWPAPSDIDADCRPPRTCLVGESRFPAIELSHNRDRRKRVALSFQSGSPTRRARGGPEAAEYERCSRQSGSPTRRARGGLMATVLAQHQYIRLSYIPFPAIPLPVMASNPGTVLAVRWTPSLFARH